MINKSSSSNSLNQPNKNHIEINKNAVQTSVKSSINTSTNNTNPELNVNKLNNLKNNADKTISETLNRLLGINIARQNTVYSNILTFTNSSFKSPFNLALYIMNDFKPASFVNNTAIFNKLLSAKMDANLLKDISHIINYRTLLFFPEIAPFLPFFVDKFKFLRNKSGKDIEKDIYKNIDNFVNIFESIDDIELKGEALSIIIKLLSQKSKHGSLYFFDDEKLDLIDSIDFYCEDSNLFVSGKFSNLGVIDIIAKFSKDYISANLFTETEEIKNAIFSIKDNIKDSKGKPVKINLYTVSEYENAVLEIKNSCRSCLNIDTLV